MASLYKKVISGKPYWYLREMGWVDGRPKMISERYLGTAADIEALLDAREAAVLPERTRHLAFGDVAAAWGVLQDLGVAAIIDEVTGARRADAGAPAGADPAPEAPDPPGAPCAEAPGGGARPAGGRAGRQQVARHDRPAAQPVPGGLRRGRRPGRRRGHDGGLRRRAELGGQLRLPGKYRPALRRVSARERLPGP